MTRPMFPPRYRIGILRRGYDAKNQPVGSNLSGIIALFIYIYL